MLSNGVNGKTPLPGLEPGLLPPEGNALSTELQGHSESILADFGAINKR